MSDPFHQEQFLTVLDRDEAERRFHEHLDLRPLEPELVPLFHAHQRVLAEDVRAPIDVPGFDRSNVDGFAVWAEDTFGAAEDNPLPLRGEPIATGGVIPRGATAVVMIEHTDLREGQLAVNRPVAPGANITWAGTDIGRGETVLFRGTVLTSRETGVLAALGLAQVAVVRRPRVGILSTGDELQVPGEASKPGGVYDSNQTVLTDAVRELGCEPIPLGIVPDDLAKLRERFAEALTRCDVVLLSGGTSKGPGDVSYHVVAEFGPPGIVAHGVALKPGKPLCLAVVGSAPLSPWGRGAGGEGSGSLKSEGASPWRQPKPLTPNPSPQRGEGDRRPIPVAVLPGFPTSAIFTFHEFVAPVLRELAGRPPHPSEVVTAILPQRVNSERGRTEYVLVGLVPGHPPTAFAMGKGSGSVTAFGRADGFLTIPRQREYLEAGELVEVRLLGGMRTADLVVIGSHCLGLDYLLGQLRERGFSAKVLAVGSTGGLDAAKRGECDVAGIHLLDAASDEYNRPFLTPGLELIPGYGRMQGIVFRHDDKRFENIALAIADPTCVMANRNRGSGTRILIDRLLNGARPPGYLSEAKSHSAVVAAVAQGRADWGVAIEPAARELRLGFQALREERFDFVVPTARRDRPAVRAFREVLATQETKAALRAMGFPV